MMNQQPLRVEKSAAEEMRPLIISAYRALKMITAAIEVWLKDHPEPKRG